MLNKVFDNVQINYFHNPAAEGQGDYPVQLKEIFDVQACKRAVTEISKWPSYQATELLSLDGLAKELGISGIYYKDESTRFGLGSFKSLGGAYEVLCLLQQQISKRVGQQVSFASIRNGSYAELVKEITVISATDGNHGRSVAWGAGLFGCHCVIYVHAKVSAGRQSAMEELGAEVVRIAGNYDDSVVEAAKRADDNGWFIVSDTSYEGYTDLPRQVMAGYTVMADEISAQLPADIQLTHTFAQGGVGGLAGAMCGYLWQTLGDKRPRFVIVEPDRADCLYQSARNGEATVVKIVEESVMAGMSCGKVSFLAWQILSCGTNDFMTIPDELIAPAMRLLADGSYASRPVIAGESAVAGVSALIAACSDLGLKESLQLNESSQVLLYGTEGATDPEIYRTLVGRSADEVAATIPVVNEDKSC